MKRCERCRRAVRGQHYSLPNCNETGKGVTLHRACAAREQLDELAGAVRYAETCVDSDSSIARGLGEARLEAQLTHLRKRLRQALDTIGESL
jgi:hypothetical protein